jgi:cellulose biosynthesis protein BcsQ
MIPATQSSIPVVAFFNNKGGVGKTTLVYHLAWMYAELGMRVIAADLDPQANLTAAFLPDEQLEQLWDDESTNGETIYLCVQPLAKRTGDIHSAQIAEVDERIGLLPGDLRLSTFEAELSDVWSKTLQGDAGALRVSSAFWRVMQAAARQFEANLIMMDLGPNLGAMNRAALISADYVVVPLSPDLFSRQGLKNLGPTLAKWRHDWQGDALRRAAPEAPQPLPTGAMQPLGYVIMQHAERQDRPVKAYGQWIEQIPRTFQEFVLDDKTGRVPDDTYRLGRIRHYHSLSVMAQDARKPIFKLRPADGAVGSHGKIVGESLQTFKQLAQEIARRISLPLPEFQ